MAPRAGTLGTAAPASSPAPRGLSFPAYSPARAPETATPAPPAATDPRPATPASAPVAGAASSLASSNPASASSAPASPPATAVTAAAPASRGDDPALPETPDQYDDNELRAAVGASPLVPSGKRRAASSHDGDGDRDDDRDPAPRRRRSPRAMAVAALGVIAILGTAALVVAGYLNSDRYLLACEAERAVPEQGRSLPPWGTRALTGEQWRPLKISPETRCQPQETDDPLVLERAYLAMVLDQATALLTAREVTKVDEAEALLEQGLLLTRPPEHEPASLAAQRTEHHQEIERLRGDVTYWRATARLREAATALGEAATKFDAAVAQHPRHASDAGAWAAYTRKLAQELRAGPASGSPAAPAAVPAGAPPPATASDPAGASERVPAPPGIALPIEPEPPGTAPAPLAAPPDAGTTTGGVLL
jgi:hypothetical protein